MRIETRRDRVGKQPKKVHFKGEKAIFILAIVVFNIL